MRAVTYLFVIPILPIKYPKFYDNLSSQNFFFFLLVKSFINKVKLGRACRPISPKL